MAGHEVIMNFSYALTPFLAWLTAGILKFIINCMKERHLAFSLIGYGGLPSNHSAIVSSMATLIALKEGIGHPAFGVAITLAFIVMLDASSLRRQVGKHAAAINKLTARAAPDHQALRERMGHTRVEIAAGIVVGIAVAFTVNVMLR
jgi:acid phosphatase family membrane protein YuiD